MTLSSFESTRISTVSVPPKAVLPILAIGTPIAALAGFDRVFDALTDGSPLLRVILFAVLATIGAIFAARIGLTIQFRGTQHPISIGIGAALGTAVAVALIDGVLFRAELSQNYVRYFHTADLPQRLEYFMLRAFNENVFYRLFLFPVLACSVSSVWPGANGGLTRPVLWSAMVGAQMFNITANVVIPSADTMTVAGLIYDTVRYISPGVFWAYLFVRYGFVTAEIASVGCHIFLQPMLGALL